MDLTTSRVSRTDGPHQEGVAGTGVPTISSEVTVKVDQNDGLDEDDEIEQDFDDELGNDEKKLDARFTSKQLQAMSERKEEYMKSTRRQKGHITRSVADQFVQEILATGKELSKAKRKKVLRNVQYWFSQRCRTRGNSPRYFHPYTARQVFYKENSKKVARRQRKMYYEATQRTADPEDLGEQSEDLDDVDSDEDSPTAVAQPGAQYFEFFQRAVSYEYNRLSEEEKARYERTAIEWRTMGPTEEVKQSRAEKDLGRSLFTIAEDLYRQMGVKVFFLISFTNSKGQHVTSQQDFGKALYGAKTNFRDTARPILNKSGLFNSWKQYTREKPSDTEQGTGPGAGSLYPLPLNDYGEPVIPHHEQIYYPKDLRPFDYLQKVVRSVMSHFHALAKGKPIQNYTPTQENEFPWGVICKDLFAYAGRQCFPSGVDTIADPSSMRKALCASIVKHWYERQQAGLIPLEFHHYYGGEDQPIPRVPRRPLVEPEPAGTSARQSQRKRRSPGSLAESSSSDSESQRKSPKKRARKSTKRSTKGKRPAKRTSRGNDSDEDEMDDEPETEDGHATGDEREEDGESDTEDERKAEEERDAEEEPRPMAPAHTSDDDMYATEEESQSLQPRRPSPPRTPQRKPRVVSPLASDNANYLLPPEGHPPQLPERSSPMPQPSSSQQLGHPIVSNPLEILNGPALQQLLHLSAFLQQQGNGALENLAQLTNFTAPTNQTPTRALAETLDRVHIDSSPTKPLNSSNQELGRSSSTRPSDHSNSADMGTRTRKRKGTTEGDDPQTTTPSVKMGAKSKERAKNVEVPHNEDSRPIGRPTTRSGSRRVKDDPKNGDNPGPSSPKKKSADDLALEESRERLGDGIENKRTRKPVNKELKWKTKGRG